MIFVAEIQQCTSTASLDLLNLGTIPYGALHKGSRKAAKASPKTTPGGTSRWNSTSARPQQKNPAANGDKRTGHRHAGTGLPPPPCCSAGPYRGGAPSTVPARLDPAADLDRPASISETATCLSDGGLQPTSRKTLIPFSPRLDQAK